MHLFTIIFHIRLKDAIDILFLTTVAYHLLSKICFNFGFP